MSLFDRIRNAFRILFGGSSTLTSDIPPIIDEVEVFENILLSILPSNWTLEITSNRPLDPLGYDETKPHLGDWDHFWILSTLWPGHEPQRIQIHLYLLRKIGTLHSDKEKLADWERFSVIAQNPSVIQINNESYTWTNLPGWPNAKDDITNVFQ